MISDYLECEHEPKKFLLEFCCYKGDYSIRLCSKCHEKESRDYLVSVEEI